ncbi:MAG TPA: hypothetical protein VFQ87_10095 [Bradyrhizobium sp.]|jgi:hypothetical protein|nr:hypothetical protein [Bradyrhizobium sp.]
MAAVTKEELDLRCAELRAKCVLLRQIHSQRMTHYVFMDNFLNIGTLIVAAIATFVGFFGISKITGLVGLVYMISSEVVDLIYNVVVFLVLIFAILNVAFQFKEKSHQHWRAINLLTDFVTDIDSILCVAKCTAEEIEKDMTFINSRYKHVVDILPPTSDRDYIRAKKMLARKKAIKTKLESA